MCEPQRNRGGMRYYHWIFPCSFPVAIAEAQDHKGVNDEGRDCSGADESNFLDKILEHRQNSNADASWYVDYELLMAANRQQCSEDDFRKLYLREAMKFLGHLRDGQRLDPDFMDMNLKALEKVCENFDNRSIKGPKKLEVGLDPHSCPKSFLLRLQNQLEAMGYRVEMQIHTVKERIDRLFEELKGNADDHEIEGLLLDEHALRKGLRKLRLPSSPKAARELLTAADTDFDGKVLFKDFKQYVLEREAQIREIFNDLDHSQTGSLTSHDLLKALQLLGISATEDDVQEFVLRTHRRLGEDSFKDSVDYATFRELLVLLPNADTESIFEYWQQAVDFDFTVTEDSLDSPSLSQKSFLETFIAGGVAGAVSRTCTAPLDRLKLLLQTDAEGKYNGILQGLRQIYEEGKQHRMKDATGKAKGLTSATGWRGVLGGLLNFFRGNGTNVVKIAPETAIKFWAYESAKPFLCKDPNHPSSVERFGCGAVGGICAQTCIYPLEIVKTRLAVSKPGTYNGITHCLFKISRKEGFSALYQGLTASVLGIVPYSGVDMAVYFTLRERYQDSGPMGMMACGAVSSTCGMVCSFPLQLVRTKLQVIGLDGMPKYSGIWHCLTTIVRKDGFFGLYKGFGPNMLKALPAISITYTVYETVKKKLINSRMQHTALALSKPGKEKHL